MPQSMQGAEIIGKPCLLLDPKCDTAEVLSLSAILSGKDIITAVR